MFMKFGIRTGLAIAILAAAWGCANEAQEMGEEAAGQVAAPGTPISAQGIVDTWLSSCMDADRLGLSEIRRFDIEENQIKLTRVFHATSSCSEPMITVEEIGTFQVQQAAGGTVVPVDIQYMSVNITANSDKGRKLLEGINACSLSEWRVDAREDVTANTGAINCWETTPRMTYDIFEVNENSLTFGKYSLEQDKSVPEKRPAALDRAAAFTRL